jgi:hypothetical protein
MIKDVVNRSLLAMGAVAFAALGSSRADASTVVTFDWVSTSVTAGQTITPTGTLTLTLATPLTSGSASGTFTDTYSTAALAEAAITGFSFEFSDGETLSLADLKASGNTITTGKTWATSNFLSPTTGTPTGYYLITSINFGGHKTFPGTTSAGNYQIAEGAGLVGNVAPGSNNVTPGIGGPAASVDAGYWELQPTAVPVPAALPLLLSGIGGLAMLGRRRKLLTA